MRAKPTAVPMNGAVQGVAITAASAPVKNEPASPERRVSPWPRPCSDDPEMEYAREAQAHCQQQIGQERDGHRRLQLEAPPDLGTGGARAEQH